MITELMIFTLSRPLSSVKQGDKYTQLMHHKINIFFPSIERVNIFAFILPLLELHSFENTFFNPIFNNTSLNKIILHLNLKLFLHILKKFIIPKYFFNHYHIKTLFVYSSTILFFYSIYF